MTADEIVAIETEIAEITIALSHIRKGGQSYTIMSASGAGTSRTVTMADYDKLLKHKNDLQRQLDGAQGKRAFRFGAGW
jgi:hypothetical protein